MLLAAGLLPILDRLDRKIREADELEPLVGAPLLAMVPDQAAPGQAPGPAVQEAFQTLRASLTYYNVDRPLDILLVSSAAHSEGKTTVATNLSAALAQDGKDVILVDADAHCIVPAWSTGRLALGARTVVCPYWLRLDLGTGPQRRDILLVADQLPPFEWARLRALLDRTRRG